MSRIGNRNSPGLYTIGSWKDLEAQDAQTYLEQRIIALERITVVRCAYRPGSDFPPHFHPREQVTIVEEGRIVFRIQDEDVEVGTGEMISIPARVRHATRVDSPAPARALNLFLAA